MELSNINLKPSLQQISPDWTRDVFLSERAVDEIREIFEGDNFSAENQHLMLGHHFLAFLTVFANNNWFAQMADHEFVGFKFGDPSDTAEGLCAYEHRFVMRRDGYGAGMKISIVSTKEGYLTEQYHIGQAIEIAKIIEAQME